MTLSLLKDVDNSALHARICIIGAGAAGITLACELDGRGYNVLLLESGDLTTGRRPSDDYRGEAEAPHSEPSQFRRVAFGGTTGLWGGRCLPLDPVDFERRQYPERSGWPISYEEVARYYPAAMNYCDAGKFDFTISGSLLPVTPTIEGFDGGGIVQERIERYSLPTDFGKRYRRKVRDSVNVMALMGARCVRLIKESGTDRIVAAEFLDQTGRRRQASADVFVLAGGGLEVPRLLMLSDTEGAGLGNRRNILGRYYMCHFENALGRLVSCGAKVVFAFERTLDGAYCRRQLGFSRAAVQAHQLLNTAIRLHFPIYSDASHGSSVMSWIYLAKSMLSPEYRAIMQQNPYSLPSPVATHVQNVLLGLPQLAGFLNDWFFRHKLARRKLPYTLVPNADGSFPIEFNSEQAPRESNRIMLVGDVDRHGLRRIRIAWQLSEEEIAAARRALILFRNTVNSSGAAKFEFDEAQLEERLRASVPLGGHHLGATRMGASESDGVVDRNCAVFGIPNLFVASSAVFPTSGHANPTLTIVALAIRLAAHLHATFGGLMVHAGPAVTERDLPIETT